ncbi:MAG: hypothetical protein OXQ93_01750 [Gemmatimonadota bacterium]|nr:hypothetical protein [Gemmatimonadota bacterium]
MGSWKELSEQGDRHPGSPALVDPSFGEVGDLQAAPSPWASEYSWYSTPLIHYARTWPGAAPTETGHPYTAFLRAGVDDDLDTMDATILRCIDVGRVHRLLERLRRCAHPFTQRVFLHAVNLAIGPVAIPVLADSLGLEERALQRHSAVHKIPRPNAIVALARIFTVERLAAWSGQPSGSVALTLGFSAKSNYRRVRRRHLGGTSTTILQRGGARLVEETIVQRLAPS